MNRAAHNREHDRRRQQAPGRSHYRTAQWRTLRLLQLQSEPLCRRCKQRGRMVLATIADHVKPHRGNVVLFFDPRNLQSLCKPCHDSSKQAEERRGHAIGNGTDGRPLDPEHPWNKGP